MKFESLFVFGLKDSGFTQLIKLRSRRKTGQLKQFVVPLFYFVFHSTIKSVLLNYHFCSYFISNNYKLIQINNWYKNLPLNVTSVIPNVDSCFIWKFVVHYNIKSKQ